jgi:hypothetical protein
MGGFGFADVFFSARPFVGQIELAFLEHVKRRANTQYNSTRQEAGIQCVLELLQANTCIDIAFLLWNIVFKITFSPSNPRGINRTVLICSDYFLCANTAYSSSSSSLSSSFSSSLPSSASSSSSSPSFFLPAVAWYSSMSPSNLSLAVFGSCIM